MAVITALTELRLRAVNTGMIPHGTAADHPAVRVEVLPDRLHLVVLLLAVSNGRTPFFEVTRERQNGVF